MEQVQERTRGEEAETVGINNPFKEELEVEVVKRREVTAHCMLMRMIQ